MAKSYHWVVSGFSVDGAILSAATPPATVAIPAGGQINRWLIKNTVFQFQQNGPQITTPQAVSWNWKVGINTIEDAGPGQWSGSADIPFEVGTLVVADFAPIVSCYWHAGDLQAGYDAGNLRYGHYDDTSGQAVFLNGFLYANQANVELEAVGEIDVEFHVLYSILS